MNKTFDLNFDLIGNLKQKFDLNFDLIGNSQQIFDSNFDLIGNLTKIFDLNFDLIGNLEEKFDLNFDLILILLFEQVYAWTWKKMQTLRHCLRKLLMIVEFFRLKDLIYCDIMPKG